MSSISLYRKWRPQKFSEVVGQDPIIKTLKGALQSGRISHAYLFTGPRGTGKTTVARLVAKAINCPKRKNFEPCNKCEICKEITGGKSLDIFEIDAASHRGIDEIKDIIEKIKFTPSSSKYKVFIIDEVHMLTREAFNALLKTLEEPPSHAIFILATTEAHKVPPTILSRCQRFDFRRVLILEIKDRLERIAKEERIKLEKGGADLIAQNSAGSLRDAIGFLDQLRSLTDNNITIADIEYILGLTSKKSVLKFLDFLFKNKTKEAVELVNQLFEKGFELPQYTKSVTEELRKILLAKSGLDLKDLNLEEEEQAKISKWLEIVSFRKIIQMIKIFKETNEYFKQATLPQLALEMAIFQIIEPEETKEELNDDNKKDEKKNITDNHRTTEDTENTDNTEETIKSKKALKNNDISQIISLWPKIIEELKKENSSLSAFMKMCAPIKINNEKLILGAKFKLYTDKINQKREIIEKAVSKLTHGSCIIECESINEKNRGIYKKHLELISEEEDKVESNLAKSTQEVFGEI